MQVLLPFTSEDNNNIVIAKEVNIGFPISKKEVAKKANISFPNAAKKTIKYQNVFNDKEDSYQRNLSFSAHVENKKSVGTFFKSGVLPIPFSVGVFNFKHSNCEINIENSIPKVIINTSVQTHYKPKSAVIQSGITKTEQKVGMGEYKADIVRMTRIKEQFKRYDGLGSAMNVNISKQNLTTNMETVIKKENSVMMFDAPIIEHKLSIKSSMSKEIGYIVDDDKLNTLSLVKGYNLLPIPIILYQNKIYKAYDLLEAIAKQLNKQTYELFSEISRKRGDEQKMFIVSDSLTSDVNGPDNFDLFEISKNSINGIPVEVYCNQDFTVDLENLNV